MNNDMDLDKIDATANPPEAEPERQYYYMAKIRQYVKQESAKLGRSMTFFTQTFGCRTV